MNSISMYIIMESIFSIIGVFFYISLILLFGFYYKCLIFIKENIFTFILVNSLTPLISLFINNPIYKNVFSFLSQTIQFSLILYFIDKCFTSPNLSKDKKDFEISYKIYIILIFMISSFPFYNYLELFEKTIFDQNVIRMVLIILLYEQIREKFQILFDYLNEKKVKPNDSDMPHEIVYYYYNIFKIISKMFYTSFFLFFLYLGLKLFGKHAFNFKTTFEYICLFINLFAIYSLIIGCILFFYSLNKNNLETHQKSARRKESFDESQTFKVINVDIAQDDIDENIEHFSRKRRKKRKKEKKKNHDENKVINTNCKKDKEETDFSSE